MTSRGSPNVLDRLFLWLAPVHAERRLQARRRALALLRHPQTIPPPLGGWITGPVGDRPRRPAWPLLPRERWLGAPSDVAGHSVMIAGLPLRARAADPARASFSLYKDRHRPAP